MIEADQIETITAADVRSSDDEKVGSVGQVFLDGQTGRPEWAAVKTGFFGTKEAFVPLRNAEWDGRVVRVAYDKERVRNAPHVDPDDRGLDPDQQVELYTYYGFTEATPAAPGQGTSSTRDPAGGPADHSVHDAPAAARTSQPSGGRSGDVLSEPAVVEPVAPAPVTESLSAVAMSELASRQEHGATPAPGSAGSGSGVPVGDGDADDAVLTRSEEHLEVTVQPVAAERVRLSKHVVTEQQTVTVTVRREELRVERVKISAEEARRLGSGDGLGGPDTEIILYEEHPVVTTVLRPVERIRLSRELMSEEQTVTGDVRKERVELESGPV